MQVLILNIILTTEQSPSAEERVRGVFCQLNESWFGSFINMDLCTLNKSLKAFTSCSQTGHNAGTKTAKCTIASCYVYIFYKYQVEHYMTPSDKDGKIFISIFWHKASIFLPWKLGRKYYRMTGEEVQ